MRAIALYWLDGPIEAGDGLVVLHDGLVPIPLLEASIPQFKEGSGIIGARLAAWHRRWDLDRCGQTGRSRYG
jgi:hypothetical protein